VADVVLRKFAGLHVYRVNKRPLDGHAGTPDLPGGITLAIVPPGKLLDAAADPALDMEPTSSARRWREAILHSGRSMAIA